MTAPIKKPRTLNLSEEQREKRAEEARERHSEKVVEFDPETGEEIERPKFGGDQRSWKPKRQRDSENSERDLIAAIADEAQTLDVQDVYLEKLYKDMHHTNPTVRQRAMKMYLEATLMHRKQRTEEVKALESAERTSLLGGILRQLGVGSGDGGDVLDGDFSVVERDGAGHAPPGLPELGPATRPTE